MLSLVVQVRFLIKKMSEVYIFNLMHSGPDCVLVPPRSPQHRSRSSSGESRKRSKNKEMFGLMFRMQMVTDQIGDGWHKHHHHGMVNMIISFFFLLSILLCYGMEQQDL